jgi:hypothetical protein
MELGLILIVFASEVDSMELSGRGMGSLYFSMHGEQGEYRRIARGQLKPGSQRWHQSVIAAEDGSVSSRLVKGEGPLMLFFARRAR